MFLRRYGYDDRFVIDLVVNIRLMIATMDLDKEYVIRGLNMASSGEAVTAQFLLFI